MGDFGRTGNLHLTYFVSMQFQSPSSIPLLLLSVSIAYHERICSGLSFEKEPAGAVGVVKDLMCVSIVHCNLWYSMSSCRNLVSLLHRLRFPVRYFQLGKW